MARLEVNEEFNKELEASVEKSGLRRGFIADKLGIEVNTLRRKLKGERSWTSEEVELLKKILNK